MIFLMFDLMSAPLYLLTACCRCCLLRLPYGTITASLLTICGLVIATTSLIQSTSIADRLFLELLHQKYIW